jgi:hypothetical protein
VSQNWKMALGVVVGTALGAGATLVRSSGSGPPKPSAASSLASISHAPVSPAESEARTPLGPGFVVQDPEALRAIVREELQRALSERASAAEEKSPTQPEPATAAPNEADIKAFDSARRTVDEGLRRGTWTTADRDRLRETSGALPPDMRDELIKPLVVAANQGRIHVETQGPLF